ncbi:MAG: hypothetical protein ACLGGX_10260 [Bdellovibrionia bacterium]
MRSSYANLMQSKYFSPAFNSAIFDGPVRIYFAQFHESQALKIYFALQQKLSHEWSRAKEVSRQTGANLLIMIYPTTDSFGLSFDEELAVTGYIQESWNNELVFGLNGPMEDSNLDKFLTEVRLATMKWHPHIKAPLEAQL